MHQTHHACRRCAAMFCSGEPYYAVPGLGDYCSDCGEALFAAWRRAEGDVTDRI